MPRRSTTSSSSSQVKIWRKLSSGARDLLLAVALHERPVPTAWVELITPNPTDVDALLNHRLIGESNEGLQPGTNVDRKDVQRLASWSQRKRLHLLLAQTCHQPPARFELAGRHLEAAGKNAEAARAYLTAADAHCRRHHHAAAKRTFFAALRLLPPEMEDDEVVRALHGLAQCATLASDVADAATELRHWVHSPPWSERRLVRAEANLVLAGLLAREERHVESARVRRTAARDLAALGRDSEAAAASLAAAGVLTFAVQTHLAQEAVDAAVNAADRVGDHELHAQAITLRGMIFGMQGRTNDGVAELERALELALRHELTGPAAEAYRLLGTVQEYASQYPDEQSAFAKALKFCRKHGETHTAGICLGCLSYSYLRSGNWKRSESTARGVIGNRKIPAPSRYVAESVLGLLHAYRGEVRPAQRLLTRSLEHCRRIGLLVMDFFNLPGLALIAESTGAPNDASNRWIEFIEFWRSTDDRHDGIPGLSAAASFFAERGRVEDAAAAAEALDAIASATSNPEATGAALAATAELLLLEGRTGTAIAKLRRAQAAYEQRVLSIEPIRVRLRLGAALIQHGNTDEARGCIMEARQRARRLGARPLAARADAVLARAAEKAAGTTITNDDSAGGWDLLSARQRDVARLLARGRTNKAIAAQLSVSVRTVEMHVAHVLARLDCRTRAEAAGRITATLA